MKKIILTIGIFGLLLTSNAQNIERCATTHYKQHTLQTNPEAGKAFQLAEKKAKEWLDQNKAKKTQSVVTIPVVVHVVYNASKPAQNISDAVIKAQIDKLNEDFRHLNADKVNIRPIFDSITADVEIEFCLAKQDPNGNSTTGITRTVTTKQSFDVLVEGFDKMKSSATGGVDPWPSDDYINIWVCDMSNSFFGTAVLGYASLPGQPIIDGLAIQYQAFNVTGQISAGGNSVDVRGRTTVHEMGHFFGLRHIWGDEGDPLTGAPGNCDSIDYVYDTPETNSQSQFDCDFSRNTCSVEDPFWGNLNPPDMIENYMDYSSETCMNAFTRGQKERMWSFLNTVRAPLLSSTKCTPALGVNEFNNLTFSVYPNPASQEITVDFTNDNQYKKIQLFDQLGRVVKAINSSQNIERINVSDLQNGVYILKVNDSIKKVIID